MNEVVDRLRLAYKELDQDKRLGPIQAVQRVRRQRDCVPMTEPPEIEALFAVLPPQYRYVQFVLSSVAGYYYDIRDQPGAVSYWFDVAVKLAESGSNVGRKQK